MRVLSGKTIVLGVTGGIAAYKAVELVRLLVKAGAQVDTVMTEAGMRFIGTATFQALTGRPVWNDLWDDRQSRSMGHIDLVRKADAIVVAPASADFLARLAQGRADDLLATLCLARDCPLLIAPAMNRQMWSHPATSRNVVQIRADGAVVLDTDCGEQACGEYGMGRMLEAADLFENVVAFFQPKRLSGRRVLLTAGPTFESLDPVRGLTNSSSGKMGFALARACVEAGAETSLVAGPVSLKTPRGVVRRDVISALEMHSEVMKQIGDHDIFIAVAAVADYRPVASSVRKIKKGEQSGVLTVELVPNPDILAEVSALPSPPFCVGFAAESHDLAEYAEAKRRAKNLPLIVGNLVQDGMGGDDNTIILFDAAGQHALPAGSKVDLARLIVGHVADLMEA